MPRRGWIQQNGGVQTQINGSRWLIFLYLYQASAWYRAMAYCMPLVRWIILFQIIQKIKAEFLRDQRLFHPFIVTIRLVIFGKRVFHYQKPSVVLLQYRQSRKSMRLETRVVSIVLTGKIFYCSLILKATGNSLNLTQSWTYCANNNFD